MERGLSGAASVEIVASLLQMKHGFVFPNLNLDDLNPEISNLIHPDRIPLKTISTQVNVLAKASFGFGDVNGCVIFRNY